MFYHKAVKRLSRFVAVLAVLLLLMSLLPAAQATGGITLSIPSLNLDTSIVTVYLAVFPEGVTWDVSRLRRSVGRLDGTSTFGQSGNTVLAGHSELSNRRAGVFHNIGNLQGGSEIIINVNGTEYHYSVVGIQNVDIYDMSVIYPSSDERLTLITCDPNSYNAATGYYDRRLAVTAIRIS